MDFAPANTCWRWWWWWRPGHPGAIPGSKTYNTHGRISAAFGRAFRDLSPPTPLFLRDWRRIFLLSSFFFFGAFCILFFWKMAGYFVRCFTPNFSFLLYSLPSCPVYPFCISITLKNSRKRNLWFINKPRLPTPHQQRLKRREMKEGRKK